MSAKKIRNSKKGRFFYEVYRQRIFDGNEDLEDTIRLAADQVGISIDQVHELFREVKNRNWAGLEAIKDGAVSAWYKVNIDVLVKFMEKLKCAEPA